MFEMQIFFHIVVGDFLSFKTAITALSRFLAKRMG